MKSNKNDKNNKNNKKKNKDKLTKFEKFLYVFTILLLITSPMVIVFGKSTLSEINYKVEKMKENISAQERTNESLDAKINELASRDNIQEIIKNEGLTYNNENIKNVD